MHPAAARQLDRLDRASSHATNDDGISDAGVSDIAKSRDNFGAAITDVGLLRPERRAGKRENHQQHYCPDEEVIRALHGRLPSSHVTAQNASSTRINTAEYTTALV